MTRVVLFLLFFVSGLTALVYQVVWTKLLTLTFGVTLLAVSTVLTCFFGGLALGSCLGGRWVEKKRSGVFWYGIAEFIVGAYALFFPRILEANNTLYAALARGETGFITLSLIKFLLSALVLILPATLMGATLPMLSKAVARSRDRFVLNVGGLYTVNTFGAVSGAVLTAFYLIPSFGQHSILTGTGLLNMAVGAAAVFLSSLASMKDEGTVALFFTKEKNEGGDEPLSRGFTGLVLWAFALSGFTGLAYEVVWTRILGFILTGTVYAFAAVLAVFLAGIAAGSFLFSLFTDRIKSRSTVITLFAIVEALIGISSIALVYLYNKLPETVFYARLDITPRWGEFVYLNFFTAFITLIVPTFLFGATFPLICKIYDWRAERVGRKIGNIYSVNTVGGIAGSFLSGFVLIPLVGMQNTVVFLGLVNVAIGLLFVLKNPLGGRGAGRAIGAAMAVAAALTIIFLPENMPLSLHRALLTRGEEIVFYKEGPTATVMIAERRGAGLLASNKRLWINGNRATAAYYEGLQINRFQGVLPMVLHPDPKDVLVICFGSGTTFGTLARFPVKMVDNVEIAPTVIEGAVNFKKENMDVLHNPRARVHIDDGRSFLVTTDKKYDVITEEPMHPALAGVVNLYTREYYELARGHLKPGGIMSQWIPLYNLSVDDVKLMVRTFQSVFPHTSIWFVNADIFMIGSNEKLAIDYGRVLKKLARPEVRRLLEEIDLDDPTEFLGTFLMNEEMVKAYVGGGPVMTDDMPVVEFTGPRSLHINTISPNLAELFKYMEPATAYLRFPEDVNRDAVVANLERKFRSGRKNIIGRAYYADGNLSMAATFFRQALSEYPMDRSSRHYIRKLRFQ